MWLLLLLALLFSPFSAVRADSKSIPMGYEEARHLLNRTSFTASESQVQEFAQLTREQAVDKLLSSVRTQAQTPPPDWIREVLSPRKIREMSEEERKNFRRQYREYGIELRAWWYQEMLSTPSPFTEKMTLFWHNHFTSSLQKVKVPQFMYYQNVLLRQHALGNFGEMLHAVSKDPAMIIYLDNVSNRKGQPNENFAREVMELFTLGEGHYTEQDVKEAARAFSGWSLDRETGQFRFYPHRHDEGIKTILGQTGNFDGDAVLDILLSKPQTAEFITTKLWREFVSPTPNPTEVKRLAALFRDSHYDIKTLMRALLTSDDFYARENRGVLIKSPVEFIVGTLRQFNIQPLDMRPLAFVARQLGQDIFAPPNVKGWPGGESWINSNTLLIRKQLLERLFRAGEMLDMSRPILERSAMESSTILQPNPDLQPNASSDREQRRMIRLQRALNFQFDSHTWCAQFKGDSTEKQHQMLRLLLAIEPLQKPQPTTDCIEFIRQLVLDPVYQLK